MAAGAAPLWHVSTITISVRQMFERRLGIYPITHDAASGTLVADEPRPHPQSHFCVVLALRLTSIQLYVFMCFGKLWF